MQKTWLYLLLPAVLACGCDKQTKINTAKIDALTQRLAVLQQIQSNQLAEVRAQLAALAPTLGKLNGTYYEKSHEDAFFFHTNTLYLLLMVDQKIEAELQTAAAERQAEHELAHAYHTNQLGTMALVATLTSDAIAAMEGRLETNVAAETSRATAALGEKLAAQIRASAPDAAELAWRQQMAADLAQLKSGLAQITAQLEKLSATHPPATAP